MDKPKLRETMWMEMKPNCYGGDTCDQVEPQWHCYADGDKDSDDQRTPLIFDPSEFAPGTKITVSEPHCPSCDEYRGRQFPPPENGPPIFEKKCECGFDWEAWVLNEYS